MELPITSLTLLLLPLFVGIAHGTTFHYQVSKDDKIDTCIKTAIDRIMRETCVQLVHHPRAKNPIKFQRSGRCGWEENKSTVHLGPDCLTENHCIEYVHHAIAGERQHPSTIIRHLNVKFNCTDKCTVNCENGGKVTQNCGCDCAHGFTGDRCEKLKLQSHFTDSSCGIIQTHRSGVLALVDRNPAKPAFCQWVVKTDDPWEKIDVEFLELDFDFENAPVGQSCADTLSFIGFKEMSGPVPCDHMSRMPTLKRVRSDSNFAFIEYRGSQLSNAKEHKGPVLKYSIVAPPPPASNEIRSYKYERAYSAASRSWWSAWPVVMLAPALLLL